MAYSAQRRWPRVQSQRAGGGRASVKALLLLMALVVSAIRAAPRYIDPGSGSFAIQILIAAAVGALMTVRLWWTRLLSIFYGLRPGSRSRERSDKRSPGGSGREADPKSDDDAPTGR